MADVTRNPDYAHHQPSSSAIGPTPPSPLLPYPPGIRLLTDEEVDPGVYRDVQTGSVVIIEQRDELPEGVRLVRYPRRFRRVSASPAGPWNGANTLLEGSRSARVPEPLAAMI